MRFRAKLYNPPLLHKVIQMLQKTSKTAVVLLAPDNFQLIVCPEAEGIHIYSGWSVSAMFEEFNVESQNSNKIGLEVLLENFEKAVKSALYSQETSLRLAKKGNQPFMEVCTESFAHQRPTIITQDVPVRILSPSAIANFAEPSLPDPSVYILMPKLNVMKSIVDKMGKMAQAMTISVNMSGELTLVVESGVVDITTHLKDLSHPVVQGRKQQGPIDPKRRADAVVDISHMSKFLHASLVNPETVILCIVERRVLIFHVLLQDNYVTYYIPLKDT